MRIVVFGAGAVGGVIGGRLFQHAGGHGHDVTLVARGAHYEAIRERGLTINDPDGSVTLRVPVVDHIDAVALEAGDVVILAMKSQDTADALQALPPTPRTSRWRAPRTAWTTSARHCGCSATSTGSA